jgi:beta-glucanase (GH16 family)
VYHRIARSRAISGAIFAVAFACHTASGQESLDLSKFSLAFNEDFTTLDVSAAGIGTRWMAHTPWNGDFGDAGFANPTKGLPFTTSNGLLRIEARKGADGKWQSGLLASVNANGDGFSQQYGYFETRAKLPRGTGLWPAFWLNTNVPKGSKDTGVEIDILEHYGKFPEHFESLVTTWPTDETVKKKSARKVHDVADGFLYNDFHTYGADVRPDWIVFYIDRKEVWRTQTPAEHKNKLMLLVNLALGSGWPIDQTPSPSYMFVDYIRAYSLK